MIVFTREFWIGVALAALVVALTVVPVVLKQPAVESNPDSLQWETNANVVISVPKFYTNIIISSNVWYRRVANSPAIPDSDAQRVINELVEAGFSPEDAAEAYRVMSEMARERRGNRQPMPGVRTNVDLKKFPLFEGEP